MVKILKVDPDCIDVQLITQAVNRLRAGEIAIFPTETVYGMGVVYDATDAIEDIYKIKGRDKNKPFTLLIYNKQMVYKFFDVIDVLAEKLMDVFWPGPLTIVLKQPSGETVGFRSPDHPVALRILKELSLPLSTTSVNKSGQKEASCVQDIEESIMQKVDMVIDSGYSRIQNPSTVVLVADQEMKILREGVISEKKIKEALINEN